MATPRVPESAFHFKLHKMRGLWYFWLKSKNGRIIAQGGGYKSKQMCERMIARIRSNAFLAGVEV